MGVGQHPLCSLVVHSNMWTGSSFLVLLALNGSEPCLTWAKRKGKSCYGHEENPIHEQRFFLILMAHLRDGSFIMYASPDVGHQHEHISLLHKELHTFAWSWHLRDNRDCKTPRSVMICSNSIILSIRSRFLSHQIHCNNNRSILIYVLSPRIIGFFIIWKRNLQKLHMILKDLLPSMARNALSWYATKMRKSSLVIIFTVHLEVGV